MNKHVTIPNSLFFAQVEAWLKEGILANIPLRGHSMRPLLRDGRDVVIIEPCDTTHLVVGEVYLFRHKGHHTLHRLRRIELDRLIMAGDGNYRLTEQCTPADVIGRLKAVQRPSGRIIDCHSRRWRWQSAVWCSLPPIVRRITLGILWRLGVR